MTELELKYQVRKALSPSHDEIAAAILRTGCPMADLKALQAFTTEQLTRVASDVARAAALRGVVTANP